MLLNYQRLLFIWLNRKEFFIYAIECCPSKTLLQVCNEIGVVCIDFPSVASHRRLCSLS